MCGLSKREKELLKVGKLPMVAVDAVVKKKGIVLGDHERANSVGVDLGEELMRKLQRDVLDMGNK